MRFPMNKYRFYSAKNKVVAVSTYAGRPVRGVAKCDPEDNFSLEKGQTIAAARCNEKVAEKRLKRAKRKFTEAQNSYIQAKNEYEYMKKYFEDAEVGFIEAHNHVDEVLNTIAP